MRAGFGAKTIFSILKKWDVDEEVLRRWRRNRVDVYDYGLCTH